METPYFQKWWEREVNEGNINYSDSSFYECQIAFEACKNKILEILKYPYPDLDIGKHINDRIKQIEEL